MRFHRLVVLALLAGCAAQGGGLMEQVSYDREQQQRSKPIGGLFGVVAPPQPGLQRDSQSLVTAAARGDAQAVDAILAQGAAVNARNPNGATALQLAAGASSGGSRQTQPSDSGGSEWWRKN